MKSRRHIDPISLFGGDLLAISKPARYLGGELGSLSREASGEGRADFFVALSFPDLYEIGMSNNAIRILYEGLNRIEGLRCERVFAPAPDFESLLKAKGLPLFTLESGLPIGEADILGFSVGYELAATSILSILERGGIPLRAAERGEADPLVIAGGPAVSNPHYLAPFLDAAFIGEAEAAFYKLVEELAALKRGGATRAALLERMAKEPAIWMPGKRAIRAVFGGFSETRYRMGRPIPTLKTVQEHGTVEIMRGCPNGCRFCHAGYYYRPQRMKSEALIHEEVEALVREGGYREITLSSLSSGDYSGIGDLVSKLNAKWSSQGVSFQLPSLKINSFNLPLVEALSEVRKGGLTFAVETPVDAWQLAINKDVSFEKTLAILEEARARGFRLAKFYFMIGLPVPGKGEGEAKAIVEFFERLIPRINMAFNVNVGTFVPKPHTPFQWCSQLGEDEAMAAINLIRSGLRRFRNIKLSYHSPFVSILESVLSRGDERVGELILAAYAKGARLDAWEEHFDRELWRSVFEAADWDPVAETRRERSLEEPLPWDDVSMRVSKASFAEEYRRSKREEFTEACMENCNHPCGSCSDEAGLVQNSEHAQVVAPPHAPRSTQMGRLLLRYSKQGNARFYQHLSVIDALSRAFLMLDLPVSHSEGFNPMPRLETVQPLPLGFSSEGEIAALILSEELAADWVGTGDYAPLLKALAARLPAGLLPLEAKYIPLQLNKKTKTLGSLAWGSVFRLALLPGSSLDLGQLCESLVVRLSELGIPRASARYVEDSIELRLPEPARKENGLMKILSSVLQVEQAQTVLKISRSRCLAGGAEAEPRSYIELLSET